MTIKPIRTMLNHSTTEIFFDNVPIPASSLIGEEGKGFKYILSGMNAERILIANECIGDAMVHKKPVIMRMKVVVFGRLIGKNQVYNFNRASFSNRGCRSHTR